MLNFRNAFARIDATDPELGTAGRSHGDLRSAGGSTASESSRDGTSERQSESEKKEKTRLAIALLRSACPAETRTAVKGGPIAVDEDEDGGAGGHAVELAQRRGRVESAGGAEPRAEEHGLLRRR